MNRISFQWRITLMTAVLIAGACINCGRSIKSGKIRIPCFCILNSMEGLDYRAAFRAGFYRRLSLIIAVVNQG